MSFRRIDHLYFPISWRSNVLYYKIEKPPVITSSHHLIAVYFCTDQPLSTKKKEKVR
ncbi:hypothetical protein METBIDRAFT_163160 [Metschnikowia bicuspidata var. bicuspidata NRRL YB-4993]|uniref:Uncharacterized protein n=1 Tax=Metschnikowia bicuspidata var. bicuspidata NRRL YB-4993 TaxID=869754 RepID=A0A1A0HFD3_9ASCO|nr:hypothetical protein METBIDRAFT_163160 [Metschnikowia bicuspidata var. bicuspidata NRRL YB-4993]OBA22607.1 hypothetical protein METBIDRAFT_163160 [Metschnikowia bicuspidata var. bicuspidata NRRL YB-4993]